MYLRVSFRVLYALGRGIVPCLIPALAAAAACGESPCPLGSPPAPLIRPVAAAAATPVVGATPVSVVSQVEHGRVVYVKHCARCHGEKGEGIDAPALMGETANRLQSFPTAAILYRYVRLLMPLDNPDSLPEEEYWAVLAYLLVQNGVIGEDVPVGPETAEQIQIKQ